MSGLPTPPSRVWRAGTLRYTTGGLAVLFCWLLWGDFAWAMKDRAVPPVMQLLFKQYGASDFLAGLLFGSLPPVASLLLGPVVGFLSDRHRGPRGRRIPFLLASTPLIVLAVAGLALSPALGGALHRRLGSGAWSADACVLASLAFFWLLLDVGAVVTNSVYAALVNDVVPREVLGRFYGLFRALGLVAAIVFNYWVFGKAEGGYAWIFLGVGGLYGFGFTAMCLKVREGAYPPPPPASGDGRPGLRHALATTRGYFRKCFGNRYYWWLFGGTTLAGMATGPVNLFSVFFAKAVHLDLALYAKCLALTYCVSLVLAYPLGWLADRVHPLRLAIGVLVLYAAAALWGGLCARDARTFSLALLAHGVIAGIWNTTTASLNQRLLPKGDFAQYSSAFVVVNSLAWIGLAPAAGFLLDRLGHDYRCTFWMGLALALAGLAACLVLHRKFMALGGPEGYRAPED
ncbi:MAG TPA: MFS transporter [Candidatus Methylacidiphilales bacterium]